MAMPAASSASAIAMPTAERTRHLEAMSGLCQNRMEKSMLDSPNASSHTSGGGVASTSGVAATAAAMTSCAAFKSVE